MPQSTLTRLIGAAIIAAVLTAAAPARADAQCEECITEYNGEGSYTHYFLPFSTAWV